MADNGSTLLQNIKAWPLSRKLSLAGVVVLCLVFFSVLIIQSRVADYSLLFANLSDSDASAIIVKLKEQKIPYRLEEAGNAIYIPADKVYETRLDLSSAGLPNGGGVGFEIFDKQSFGMTDFTQKVNYMRALQGELARTIASLAQVQSARVHLVLPDKSLFKDQQDPTTASVLLKLKPGRTLNPGEIQGVIHLVAGSVEGLEANHVTLIDSSGRVLSPNSADDQGGPMTPGMLGFEQSIEKRLAARAQSLLDRALGPGNSLVQVTAKVDFSQRERTEETYDPNATALRSEQVTSEKSGATTVGGVPGVKANLQKGGSSGGGSVPSSRSEDITNYEVSKVVSHLVEPVGTIKNLSVAVLVGDRETDNGAGKKPTYTPRSAKELQDIQKMVSSAIGIDSKRGDQINVVSMPFENEWYSAPAPAPVPAERIYPYLPLIKYGLLVLGALLLYLLLIRPLVKVLSGEKKLVEHYKTVEELEAELSGEQPPLLGNPDDPAARLRKELARSNSSPSQVIKAWLNEN